MTRLLVVTAVEGERAAVCRRLTDGSTLRGDMIGLLPVTMADTPAGEVVVCAGGVGPVAAAVSTTVLISNAAADGKGFDLVINAGIAGGFRIDPGSLVCGSAAIFGDFGVETNDSEAFATASALGLGIDRLPCEPTVAAEIAQRTGAFTGPILTVTKVTGTAATASARRRHYPGALAEAMEGVGVAAAALTHGVRFAEVRAISNVVGPRDKDSWNIPAALDRLAEAFGAITASPLVIP